MLVGIVDYGLGNVKSVKSAFEYLGHEAILCQEETDFEKVSHIVLPGVGAFERGMELINQKKLDYILNTHVLIQGKPTLGICLGLQLMAQSSYEFGIHSGLSWFPGEVVELPQVQGRRELPNIGWESIEIKKDALFEGISNLSDFYFVHSFHLKLSDNKYCLATYEMGNDKIVAAIKKENIIATQFHPEKSQENGLKLLENFLMM
jgi:imidazole glycerol-phosphate synthase subunit HisH